MRSILAERLSRRASSSCNSYVACSGTNDRLAGYGKVSLASPIYHGAGAWISLNHASVVATGSDACTISIFSISTLSREGHLRARQSYRSSHNYHLCSNYKHDSCERLTTFIRPILGELSTVLELAAGSRGMGNMPAFLLASLVVALVYGATSSFDVGVWHDAPMSSSALQYLDSSSQSWFVSALDGSVINISAQVPGDTITDLQAAGIIGDPIYELNFLDGRWDRTSWNYSVTFALSPLLSAGLTAGTAAATALVLESVKLVGDVYVNGVYLGFVADQFLRYSFPVQSLLSPAGLNSLSIVISNSTDPRLTEGRITGAGGGWDWGPIRVLDYRENRVVQAAADDASMSRGLVRSLYLLQTNTGALVINQTVPLVFYQGPYPSAPLTDETAGPFLVSVTAYLSNPNSAPLLNLPITVQGSWGGGSNSTTIPSLPVGDSKVTVLLTVPAGMVQLWWTADTTPASRRGSPQPLYTVTVTVTPSPGTPPLVDARLVGFKVFTLVTADDTNPHSIAGLDGSGNLTTRFKLNGANIFSRGADVIPMEWLEGRQSSAAYVRMLTSAVEGGFNTIRVDGIDAYFPDVFYDTCDQLGLLLYHDLQYSQAQPNPVASPMQDAELRYQVRRLAPHASMAVWDGCNECGGHGIYASFLMTVVAQEDPSHPPWPASPSPGWSSGVDTLTSLPNGSPMGLQPREAPPAGLLHVESAAVHAHTLTLACASGASCTAQINVDYCNSCFDAPHPAAATAQACCDACTQAGAQTCWAAVFYEETCWFKAQANTSTPLYAPGRVAVWPAGSGPPPPLPPPGPEPHGDRETHGPYMHGNGFPAVDVVDGVAVPALPPSLFPSYTIGVQESGTYASEFGCVAFSSFESMAGTLAQEHWGMHGGTPADTCTPYSFFQNCTGGNVMAQRNYPMDNIVNAYFGEAAVGAEEVGLAAFARHTWMSITAQALHLASDIQTRRSHNTWGSLVWQLNEIWPTGGWGSVEYGVAQGWTGGQIMGGRWKPLHHWMARHLYKDLLLVCGVDGRCFVKNDDALASHSSLTAQRSLLRVTDGAVLATFTTGPFALPIGGGAITWFCMDNSPYGPGGYSCNSTASVLQAAGCAADGSDCVLSLLLLEGPAATSVHNAHSQLLAPPFTVGPSLPFKGNLTVSADPVPGHDGSIAVYVSFDPSSLSSSLSSSSSSSSSSSRVALLVTLTSVVPGRFSDNAFTLVEASSAAAASCPDSSSLCPVRVAGQYTGQPHGNTTQPTLFFYPWSDDGMDEEAVLRFVQEGVRVQHLGQYFP